MDPVATLARQMGILPEYVDFDGKTVPTSRESELALLSAMGVQIHSDREAEDYLADPEAPVGSKAWPRYAITRPDQAPPLDIGDNVEWHLWCEDGSTVEGRGAQSLTALPLGIHRISFDQQEIMVLSAPERLPLPNRAWGMMAPLAGLRSADQGGLGDYRDLAEAARAAAAHGASFIGINPVHAGFPTQEDAFSPYSPSHRRRLNAVHIAAGMLAHDHDDLIDFEQLIPAKLERLRAQYAAFKDPSKLERFARFHAAEGEALELFALHQALSVRHGPLWTEWPDALRDPKNEAVWREADDLKDETRFHAWLQWMAENQLAEAANGARAAGMRHGLYLDLAVGTHPAGAETWEDRESFAFGASLGAPPDAFAKGGQSWNLAPFNPARLISSGFRALAETLRKQLQFSGLLRIDHILGFDRAFWVPQSGDVPGAYVRMPVDAMLAVARIEAARAGAFIVGEDLGVIPPGFHEQLSKSGILGCRLAMFEKAPGDTLRFKSPEEFDEDVVASFGTHDLPTWRGWRTGEDISLRLSLGHIDAEQAAREQAKRAAEREALDAAMGQATGTADVPADVLHDHLAATRARLIAVQAEDVFGVARQPNLPGTTDEYPNWRHRLPVGARDWSGAPELRKLGEIMQSHGR